MILKVNIFISTVVYVPNVMNKCILSVCVDALIFNPCSSFILRVLNPTGSREDRDSDRKLCYNKIRGVSTNNNLYYLLSCKIATEGNFGVVVGSLWGRCGSLWGRRGVVVGRSGVVVGSCGSLWVVVGRLVKLHTKQHVSKLKTTFYLIFYYSY